MGEVGCLAIGDFWNDARPGHQAWVSGEHTVHIGPKNDLGGSESGAQNGSGIIRAASAESREYAFRCSADVAGHHGDDSPPQKRAQAQFTSFTRQIHMRVSAAMKGVGHHKIGSFDCLAGHSKLREHCRDKRSGHALAYTCDCIAFARRQRATLDCNLAKVLGLAKNLPHFAADAVPVGRRMNQDLDNCVVLLAQLLENYGDALTITCNRQPSCLIQFVSHPAHCGDNHDHRAVARIPSDDFGHFAYASCIAQ